jgi:hypothetical protein
MSQNIDRAVRDMFHTEGRATRNIKYYFRHGENSADQLADYRTRVHSQIRENATVENVDLDRHLLD